MQVQEPKPGEVIGGRYFIESELGRGGFGVVFKARHIEIDRPVAIKVLLVTYAQMDATAVERFRREAKIAASLGYPNTVQLFDYGETEHGVFYIVMELIHGKPLGDVMARAGVFKPRRAVHVARQVLHALMEAHGKGIVHRDIKPDNIMICPLAYDAEFVKVMDFGIAKMADPGAAALTAAGLTLGTPRYMPYEQLKGQALTAATDLYAVGLVLFEMLTGKPAFDGNSAAEIALAVLDGPSLEFGDDCAAPPLLREITTKACAKHPEDRFQSARAFLEALDEWQPEVEVLPELGEVDLPGAGKPLVIPGTARSLRQSTAEDDEDETGTIVLGTRGRSGGPARANASHAPSPPPPRAAADRTASTVALAVADTTSVPIPGETPPPSPVPRPSAPGLTPVLRPAPPHPEGRSLRALVWMNAISLGLLLLVLLGIITLTR